MIRLSSYMWPLLPGREYAWPMRYNPRIPVRFWTLAITRSLDEWDRETFGRRSFRGNVMRCRSQLLWRGLKVILEDRRHPRDNGKSRLYVRARERWDRRP